MHYARNTPKENIAPIWRYWPEESAIKQWARELATAAAAPIDEDLWGLVGQAVVVEHGDLDVLGGILRKAADIANLDFLQVPSDQVAANFDGWSAAIPSDKPTMLYLEPGLWVSSCLDGDEGDLGFIRSLVHDEVSAYEFRKALREFLLTRLPNYPSVIVTGLKSYFQLDPILRSAGLFDRRFSLPVVGNEGVARAFLDEMGQEKFDASVIKDMPRLGALVRYEFDNARGRGLLRQALRRFCWREGRPVSFYELVVFATYGTMDREELPRTRKSRFNPAIHEAGHALIEYLDSSEHAIPVYISVSCRSEMSGVMVGAFDTSEVGSCDNTYADIVHRIRVGLAGRAAEHLVFGAENVTFTGAQDDLAKAHNMARDLFAIHGHAPSLRSEAEASSNLTIVQGRVLDAELCRVEAMCRHFLQEQYLIVFEILQANRQLLERLGAALADNGAMFHEEIATILRSKT